MMKLSFRPMTKFKATQMARGRVRIQSKSI